MNELIIDNSLKAAKKSFQIAQRKKQMQKKGKLSLVSNQNIITENSNSQMPTEPLVDNNIDEIPFFAWECITIQFKCRYLDIVVKDELQMEILLKFLIMETNTFDSNRDSINFLKDVGIIGKTFTAQ